MSYGLNIPINLRWEMWSSDFVVKRRPTGWKHIEVMRFTQSSRHKIFRLVTWLLAWKVWLKLATAGRHKILMWHSCSVYEKRKCPSVPYYIPSYNICLRRCAISRTVPGSIPGGVTGFFSDIFPSDRAMTLGWTQSLVKMSTRNIPGGKGGRCVGLTTSPP